MQRRIACCCTVQPNSPPEKPVMLSPSGSSCSSQRLVPIVQPVVSLIALLRTFLGLEFRQARKIKSPTTPQYRAFGGEPARSANATAPVSISMTCGLSLKLHALTLEPNGQNVQKSPTGTL